MSGTRSFYFRESVDTLMRARWVAPYLLIPPMLAFMVYAEGYLTKTGFMGSFSHQQRTVLALWNATLLLSLAAGIKSCMFFSKLWGSSWFRNSLSLPVSRASGFWGPVVAMMVVSMAMYALATGAIIAALPGAPRFPWVEVLVSSCMPVVWAVCFGATLGMLTSGAAGAVLFSSVLLLGVLAGLPAEPPLQGLLAWLVPPVGRTMIMSLRAPQNMRATIMLLTHSAFALSVGRLLYGYGISRR